MSTKPYVPIVEFLPTLVYRGDPNPEGWLAVLPLPLTLVRLLDIASGPGTEVTPDRPLKGLPTLGSSWTPRWPAHVAIWAQVWTVFVWMSDPGGQV